MSSAILYLAIIAIWACILIPRWLRRDSARSVAAPQEVATPTESDTDLDSVPEAEAPITVAAATAAQPNALRPPAPDGTAEAAEAAEARRRVLVARRRLLWMMLGLEAAGGALAGTGLAAWWVIAPPTVMLAGYLLLLREAAQADVDRAAREREAIQATQARARERARRGREARKARAATQPPLAPIAPPAAFASAPVPEDYDDLAPGRDFTPGLRYASSSDDEEAYDQYTENRLRAVGDLAPILRTPIDDCCQRA
jgi:hypothetical protein